MAVLIFTATDPQAPDGCKWVAGNLPDGAVAPNFYCCAESPQAARDKMQAFLHPPPKIKDVKNAVIIPGEPEPEAAPVSVADDDGEVL